jgi:hypothetical protein
MIMLDGQGMHLRPVAIRYSQLRRWHLSCRAPHISPVGLLWEKPAG